MESGILANLEKLTRPGPRGIDMRPTLLRVLTDLYVQRLTHTAEEERHYTELALRLLDAVDVPTRIATATRLARHLAPPPRVVERLAADLPDVAALLKAHPLLQKRAESTAESGQPAAQIVEAEPAPPSTGTFTPEPPDASSEEAPLQGLVAPAIARDLNEMFFAAGALERRLILLNLELVAPTTKRVEIVREPLLAQRLEMAALTRNREEFALAIANALHISRAQARRVLSDGLGEPIVAATKALAIPREVVYRILLFVNSAIGHSVERVHALANLYDELSVENAEHLVGLWQALGTEERAGNAHRPLLYNDERLRARSSATTVRRLAATPARSTLRRDAS